MFKNKITGIFTSACSKIPNVIFFAHMLFFHIFAPPPTFIVISLLIWITFSTIKFTSTFAWYVLLMFLVQLFLLSRKKHLNLNLLFYFEHILYCNGTRTHCSCLNFRYRDCFEQGAPWHSGKYRVWIHCEMCTWHDKNIQTYSTRSMYLLRCKLIKVCWAMHCWLFKDIHFV